jgi:hypothetical protein
MTGLIVPPHIKAKHRPYAAAPLEDLLQELHHRQELHEVSAEAAMPLPEEAGRHALTPEQIQALRNASFQAIFKQIGEALAGSGLAFTGTGHHPPDLREYLVAKLCIVKHPMIPRQ